MKQNLLFICVLIATGLSAAMAAMNPFWQGALAVFMALSAICTFNFLRRYPVANRYLPYLAVLVSAAVFAVVGAMDYAWVPLFAALSVLALLGTLDLFQSKHSLRRNYPLIARIRWLVEAIRPEIRQYLFESDNDPGVLRSLLADQFRYSL